MAKKFFTDESLSTFVNEIKTYADEKDEITRSSTISYVDLKLGNDFQEKLVSSTNIKTINNQSILGSGNIQTANYYIDVNFEMGQSWTISTTLLNDIKNNISASLRCRDTDIVYTPVYCANDYMICQGFDADGYYQANSFDQISINLNTGAATRTTISIGGGGTGDAMASTNPTGTGSLSLNRKNGSTIGEYSVAVGIETTASGYYSHAEGAATVASGECSHAEGESTEALGGSSHAEGYATCAEGNYSHAEGGATVASGKCSHAEGESTEALGDYSHAAGIGTFANTYQYVVGKYNTNTAAPTSLTDTTATTGIFIVGIGSGDISSSRKNGFRVNPAGKVYGVGTYGTSGADYAEYFEWLDGNPDNEDRRGRFVTLEGHKIRYATSNDDYILGIVSANPSVAGDVYSEDWHNTYLKDVFGSNIVDVVEVAETTNEDGEIIPAHTERRWVLNPDYDPNLKYTSREERPEWAAIGLVGKLVVVDDGTCQVNSYCQPNVDGIATASHEKTNYRVMQRLDDTHIKVFIK